LIALLIVGMSGFRLGTDAFRPRGRDTEWVTGRQQAVDVVVAALVGVGCSLEVWGPSGFGSTHMTGPRAAVFAAYMLAVLSLAFRRRAPLASAFVLAAGLTAEWLAFGSPEGFGVFVTLVLAGYSVAANTTRVRALVGLGALAVAAAVWTLRDPTQTTVHAHVSGLGWMLPVAIAWLLGAYMRELRERATRAEREREERAAAAAASERARIARELHDIVAHNVSVMVVQAEAADEMLERDKPERARTPIRTIEETGRSALTDMRRLLGLLRETDTQPALGPQPGIANLELLLVKMREAGLPVELEVEGEPEPLPPGVDLSAYRIVQEALTNALKHAGPARARVLVRFAGGALELEVINDGVVANGAGADGGHGLVGMRERVALFGGELQAGPDPEGGFRVRARLPLGAGA
jgi:signal transduction histidine kinase